MIEITPEVLAKEAEEAEAIADAEERGERTPAPGQRPRRQRDASQVYSVRLPAEAIIQLRALAETHNEPPTALLRRFVLERLAIEARADHPDPLAEVVDALLPLIRQRLNEAGTEATAPRSPAPPGPPDRIAHPTLNLGPSRRKPSQSPQPKVISA